MALASVGCPKNEIIHTLLQSGFSQPRLAHLAIMDIQECWLSSSMGRDHGNSCEGEDEADGEGDEERARRVTVTMSTTMTILSLAPSLLRLQGEAEEGMGKEGRQ